MASVSVRSDARLDHRVDETNHPTWMQSFSYETRAALIDQDLEAGHRVSGVLVAIVTGGLILGLVGVLLAIATL